MSRNWPHSLPAWLADKKALDSPVISSRVRLARNFVDARFPLQADEAELRSNLARIEAWAGKHPQFKLGFKRLSELDEMQRTLYAERGLVGIESVSGPREVGLAVVPGETLSLLVNEEDHLRVQVMLAGLNLQGALETARGLEANLSQALPFASHRQFGYLTACPTNVGTGLRASVLLHLPALALTRGVVSVLQAVIHMGLSVRGFYGDGAELRSVFFQIGNQVTLGRTEEEIIRHLEGVARQIVEREEEARDKLLKEQRLVLEDRVGRALGVLANCVLIGLEEALDLLSTVRLGVETGLVAGIESIQIRELLLRMQPAHVLSLKTRPLSAEAQAAQRAALIKRRLRLNHKS